MQFIYLFIYFRASEIPVVVPHTKGPLKNLINHLTDSETNCRVLKKLTGIKELLTFVQMDFRISIDW